MKKLTFALLACALIIGGGTATLAVTPTPTPAATPTLAVQGVFIDSAGAALMTCASTPCYSNWEDVGSDPVFEFSKIAAGAVAWSIQCRVVTGAQGDNYYAGKTVTFSDGTSSVTDDDIKTIAKGSFDFGIPLGTPAPVGDDTAFKECRLAITSCSSCSGVVAFRDRSNL